MKKYYEKEDESERIIVIDFITFTMDMVHICSYIINLYMEIIYT